LLHDIPLYIVLAKDTGLRGTAVRAEMVRASKLLLLILLFCAVVLSI
jgi:hypothetical protein